MKMSRSFLVGIGILFGAFLAGPQLKAGDLAAGQVEERLSEAIHGLDTITELWEEERYDDLYDRGTAAFRASMAPEQFSFLMRNSTRGPQCCFKRFQEATGRFMDPDHVEVTVTLGYRYTNNAVSRGPSAPLLPEHERESFILVHEAGRWRLDLNQVLDRAWIPGRRY